MLRGKKPDIKQKRLKLLLYGRAGVGKTTAAIQFPNSYILDTERGTDFYAKTINQNGSVVLPTSNPDEIKEELNALLTEKHSYKTLIVDPITQVYNAVQEKWTKIFEKHSKIQKDSEVQDFGLRYWSKVKSEFKALQRIILSLDMNVIILSHQKDVYGAGFSKVGVTFDSIKNEDYIYDLVFRLEKRGNKRLAIKEKERAEIGKNKFPDEFEWSYNNFIKYYGKEVIEKEAIPLNMATKEQVDKLNKLLDIINVDDEITTKWLSKADVSSFDEFTGDQINKCIKYCEDKLKTIKDK